MNGGVPQAPISVVWDLSPLQTGSAQQGIGRYVDALAMACLEASEGDPTWRWEAAFFAEGGVAFAPLADALAATKQRTGAANSAFRYRELLRALRKRGACLYHFPEPWPRVVRLPAPAVITVHDVLRWDLHRLYSRRIPEFRRLQWWIRHAAALYRARAVTVVSQHTARRVARLFPRLPGLVEVVYPGLDHGRFSPRSVDGEEAVVCRWIGARPGPQSYFLFVGTGDPRKNLPFLLEALAVADLPVPLVLVGKLHPLHEPPIRQAIRRHGVEDRVVFLGYVEDRWLPALYRHALALLFPSLGEGFGLPIVEAMACGTPVVAFANSSIPEVAGDAAWLVPTNDLHAFVEAMRVLAGNPEKRQELVARSLERARLFTWEKTAQGVLSVYRKVLGLPE